MKGLAVRLLKGLTRPRYSLVLAIGWLVAGNVAEWNRPLWQESLLTFGVFFAAATVNAILLAFVPRKGKRT